MAGMVKQVNDRLNWLAGKGLVNDEDINLLRHRMIGINIPDLFDLRTTVDGLYGLVNVTNYRDVQAANNKASSEIAKHRTKVTYSDGSDVPGVHASDGEIVITGRTFWGPEDKITVGE